MTAIGYMTFYKYVSLISDASNNRKNIWAVYFSGKLQYCAVKCHGDNSGYNWSLGKDGYYDKGSSMIQV